MIMPSIFSNILTINTHSSPLRARYLYGVPFASLKFDLYYAAFIALLNVKAWYSVIMAHDCSYMPM